MVNRIINSKPMPSLIETFIDEGYTPIDMHFHTNHSMDSIAVIKAVQMKAKDMQIGVAVTDHNQYTGSYEMCKKNSKIPTIPGIEVTSREGVHSLYYFYDRKDLKSFFNKELKPNYKKNPFFANLTTEEIMRKTENYNCVIGAPHPFAPGTTGMHKIEITDYMRNKIDVVEGKNGYNLLRLNKRAIKWAEEINKPMTAGSDGHSVFELGTCLTFIKGHSSDSYLKNLLKGRSIIVGDEESMFMKVVMAFEKEEKYFNAARKINKGSQLIRTQFLTEFEYFKKKFLNKSKRIETAFEPHH